MPLTHMNIYLKTNMRQIQFDPIKKPFWVYAPKLWALDNMLENQVELNSLFKPPDPLTIYKTKSQFDPHTPSWLLTGPRKPRRA